MILRLLAIASLAAASLPAQFAFSVVRDGAETPAATLVQIGTAAAGDSLDTLFRVRNTGKSIAPLTMLSIAGSAYALADLPPLPASLMPGASLDFTVRFQPPSPGTFSALLRADGVSTFLSATGIAALTVYVDRNGVRTPVDASTPVDFGTLLRGAQGDTRFVLVNQTPQQIVSTLSTVGSAFQLASGTPPTLMLDSQSSAAIDVIFTPAFDGPQQGAFRIDQRSFSLLGAAVEPPLPKPLVIVDLNGQAPSSGMQPQVEVRFDPPPATSGAGKLRIDFQPSIAGATGDPAILFLPTSSRTIDFSVIEGEPNAQFGPTAAVPFQTGTTAGTIVLTAQVGDYAETATIEIPPQPVEIDSVKLTPAAGSIALEITGWDNTRSLAQASFTFLKADGTPIPPGTIQQDVGQAFSAYFANSTTGGAFSLNASFPFTGSATLIDSVKVVLANGAGQSQWP